MVLPLLRIVLMTSDYAVKSVLEKVLRLFGILWLYDNKV